MARQKLLVDTNIILDFLNRREPFYDSARLLMIAGKVGELNLWVSSSQVTDIVFVATEGGKRSLVPLVLERLRGLRTFVNVYPVTDADVDKMLATTWADPEDALLFDIAMKVHADAIITRDKGFPPTDMVNVFDCAEFFQWMGTEHGLFYEDIAFQAPSTA